MSFCKNIKGAKKERKKENPDKLRGLRTKPISDLRFQKQNTELVSLLFLKAIRLFNKTRMFVIKQRN